MPGALWGRGGRAHYLDVLLRRGREPWAVELKVLGGGGAGAYYRHGVAQAVLHRHFIRSATPVHTWFADAGMDAAACRVCLAVPCALSPRANDRMQKLRTLAGQLDVSVAEIDWQPGNSAGTGGTRLVTRIGAGSLIIWCAAVGNLCWAEPLMIDVRQRVQAVSQSVACSSR